MPCPYLPGRVERNLFTELRGPGSQDLHNRLACAGFRRSHYIVYRPACQDCNACVPVRVVVASFSLRGSLRRVMRCNEDVSAHVTRPKATPEQYELFARYQRARHPGGEMAAMSFNDYRAMGRGFGRRHVHGGVPRHRRHADRRVSGRPPGQRPVGDLQLLRIRRRPPQPRHDDGALADRAGNGGGAAIRASRLLGRTELQDDLQDALSTVAGAGTDGLAVRAIRPTDRPSGSWGKRNDLAPKPLRRTRRGDRFMASGSA